MIKALIAGERDPSVLAELAKGALRLKRNALGAALTGRFTGHHAFLAQQVLAHVEYLDCAMAQCDTRIEAHPAISRDGLTSCARSRAWPAAVLKRCWRRWAMIGPSFPARPIWPRGPVCAPAMTLPPASGGAARRAAAIAVCG